MFSAKLNSAARCICKTTQMTPSRHGTIASAVEDVELFESTNNARPCIYSGTVRDHETQHKNETSVSEARPFKNVPGPRGLPIIGNALKYSKFGRI